MLDPFQHRYGNMLTATLLLPALMSDILWVACILAALGKKRIVQNQGYDSAKLCDIACCVCVSEYCLVLFIGGTMSVILGLSSALSIIISAGVSITYTFLGGFYSVAYTDIIQLSFIFVSLVRNTEVAVK